MCAMSRPMCRSCCLLALLVVTCWCCAAAAQECKDFGEFIEGAAVDKQGRFLAVNGECLWHQHLSASEPSMHCTAMVHVCSMNPLCCYYSMPLQYNTTPVAGTAPRTLCTLCC